MQTNRSDRQRRLNLQDSPEYKAVLQSVIKYEIQSLLERLSETGEESVVLMASSSDGSTSHLGSQKGTGFLQCQLYEDLEKQFLSFCAAFAESRSLDCIEGTDTSARSNDSDIFIAQSNDPHSVPGQHGKENQVTDKSLEEKQSQTTKPSNEASTRELTSDTKDNSSSLNALHAEKHATQDVHSSQSQITSPSGMKNGDTVFTAHDSDIVETVTDFKQEDDSENVVITSSFARSMTKRNQPINEAVNLSLHSGDHLLETIPPQNSVSSIAKPCQISEDLMEIEELDLSNKSSTVSSHIRSEVNSGGHCHGDEGATNQNKDNSIVTTIDLSNIDTAEQRPVKRINGEQLAETVQKILANLKNKSRTVSVDGYEGGPVAGEMHNPDEGPDERNLLMGQPMNFEHCFSSMPFLPHFAAAFSRSHNEQRKESISKRSSPKRQRHLSYGHHNETESISFQSQTPFLYFDRRQDLSLHLSMTQANLSQNQGGPVFPESNSHVLQRDEPDDIFTNTTSSIPVSTDIVSSMSVSTNQLPSIQSQEERDQRGPPEPHPTSSLIRNESIIHRSPEKSHEQLTSRILFSSNNRTRTETNVRHSNDSSPASSSQINLRGGYSEDHGAFNLQQTGLDFTSSLSSGQETLNLQGSEPPALDLSPSQLATLAAIKEEEVIHCDFCGTGFKSRLGLQVHLRTFHERSSRYMCTICNRNFNSLINLKEHMNSHPTLKPYCCERCDKRFMSRRELLRHERMFHGNPSAMFICKICGTGCNCKTSLMEHIRGLHGGKTYRCHKCNKIYRWRSSLSFHAKRCMGISNII
ncbi:hypothetical protein CHS0354_020872 [Potamilus streckersoni]|uniref:C2H2-type domain-containing protein n=1 Tax=Potamilus streckersoni TaxID=2493646 RepID=A0AAE0VUW4_9BIVA|nr:hypothetical protein CHS0354_020872 [Potamilus streckersoni]